MSKIKIHYFHFGEDVPKYLGYIENRKLNNIKDAEKLFKLCNWTEYSDNKPKDLKSDIEYASHGICFTNIETKEKYLAKSFGWIKGKSSEITDYVRKNKDKPIWI